jgi:DNA-binding response OmpR family regulator
MRRMSVLLVEDDLPLGSSLQRVLTGAGFHTVWLRGGADAKAFLLDAAYELVLLDVVLPDISGLEVLRWLRARGDSMPVMMLTARDAVSDRVAGLDGGADDYLPKPFAMEELLSRVRALLRRHRQQLNELWRVGAVEIDSARRRVLLNGSEVTLSAREFDILLAMAASAGKVMTRAQIERVAAVSASAESNVLDVHIHNLRKKLGSQLISTVRGVGYVLERGAT